MRPIWIAGRNSAEDIDHRHRIPTGVATCLLILIASWACPLIAAVDNNQDGLLDIRDIQVAITIALANRQQSFPGQGDSNSDGTVDASDIQILVNEVLGLPQPLAVSCNSSLPISNAGQLYEHWLSAYGGTQPRWWTYRGILPPGMLFSVDGRLFGFPPLGGTFQLEVEVSDASGARDSATLSLTVNAQNGAPSALPDFYVTPLGVPLNVSAPGVLANDTDPENDLMTATLIQPPATGSLTLMSDGGFQYLPQANFSGQVQFTYSASDGFNVGSIGVAYISVAIPSSSSLSISVSVTPNPLHVTEALTINAVVIDSGNNLPTSTNIQSVELTNHPLGPIGTTALSLTSILNPQTAVYSLTVPPLHSLAYGMHELSVTVTNLAQQTAVNSDRFVVYTAPAVRVGPNRTYTTIQAGINAVPVNGAVLVDPGTYHGFDNVQLNMNVSAVLAGTQGYGSTYVSGVNLSVCLTSAGPSRDTIVMGITFELGGDAAIHLNNQSPTMFRTRVTDSYSDAYGGGVKITGHSAWPLLVECKVDSNKCGELWMSGSRYGGGVSVRGGARLTCIDCEFLDNLVYGQYASRGGAIAIDGGPLACELKGCRFEDNIAQAGYEAGGGAVFVAGGQLDIEHCIFTGNKALSPAVTLTGEFPVTLDGYEAEGGALHATMGATVDVFDSVFASNLSEGRYEGGGGAVYVEYCAVVVLDQCLVESNIAAGITYEGEGGAIATGMAGSIRCDNSKFVGNLATGPYGAYGGVFYSGTSHTTYSNPWYIGFHNCLMSGNSLVAGNSVSGSAMFVYNWFQGSGIPIVIVEGCTITGNIGSSNTMVFQKGNVSIVNSIIWSNSGNGIIAPATGLGSIVYTTSNIGPGATPAGFLSTAGNISADPLFVSAPGIGDYLLSQTPMQAATSPCVNTGTGTPSSRGIGGFSTAIDQSPDIGVVDMGYHIIPDSLPLVPRSPVTALQVKTLHPCQGPVLSSTLNWIGSQYGILGAIGSGGGGDVANGSGVGAGQGSDGNSYRPRDLSDPDMPKPG